MMPGVEFCENPYQCVKDADAAVIVTEWNVLRALDLDELARTMRQPILVDLRNVYPPEDAETAGLRYYGVGRPPRQD
jgi:UDPglucose 6-dehydrogenase